MHLLSFFSTKKQNIALILISVLCSTLNAPLLFAAEQEACEQPPAQTTPAPSVYERLAHFHLPSLAAQSMVEDEAQKKLKEENVKKLQEKKLKELTVPTLGNVEKLRLMYQTLSHNNPEQKDYSLNDNVVHDLELFCGSPVKLEHHIFGQLDHTQTTIGKIELQKMLLEPTADIVELERRQTIIKTLVNDEKLFTSCQHYLQALKETENEFVWFWKQFDEAAEKFFDQVYFSNEHWIDFSSFNKSTTPLQLSAWLETIGKPFQATLVPFLSTAMTIYLYQKMVNVMCHFAPPRDQDEMQRFMPLLPFGEAYIRSLKAHKNLFWDIPCNNFYEHHVENLVAFMGMDGAVLNHNHNDHDQHIDMPTSVRILAASIAILFIAGWGLAIRESINKAAEYNTITNIIHSKMINTATYLKTLESLGHVIAGNKDLTAAFPEHQNLIALTTNNDFQTETLIELLKTDTFKGSPSFFSMKGRALAAFKKMIDSKNNFFGSLQTAGKLDAYVSIATLYKKYKDHPNAQFCFVTYKKDATTPYLAIENFWHPYINPDKVVTNNVELGQQGGACNMILTGPNAGGKSTVLRSIVLAIILAQTMGIAPAHAMTVTPFANIITYLNIPDTEGKESLFQAEMHRCQDLIASIQKLKPHEFGFAIMDEIFTGTNPDEGQEGAYHVARNIAYFPNHMAVIATHFRKLTELDKATNGACKNCKVSVIINPDNTITPVYKLEDGASDQRIALLLMQNAGLLNNSFAQGPGGR